MSLHWSIHSRYQGTRDHVSQPRSLRGLTLSADGASLYLGFIQGTTSASLRRVSSSPIAEVIVDGSASITAHALLRNQAKGVAIDDRGYVYATLNPFGPDTNLEFGIFSADLQPMKAVSSNLPVSAELGGIATCRAGDAYSVFLSRRNGSGIIERWEVTDHAAIQLHAGWGQGGRVDLATTFPGAECSGGECDSDGSLYVAGQSAALGGAVFRLAPDGSPTHAVGVNGAADIAIYGEHLYVTQYLANHSAIAVLDKHTMAMTVTLKTGIAHPNHDADSGYSGIAISSTGVLYVADQIHHVTAPNRTRHEQILMAQL